MKTKSAGSAKKRNIIVKDLKTRKNPKGGFEVVQNLGSNLTLKLGSTTALLPYVESVGSLYHK